MDGWLVFDKPYNVVSTKLGSYIKKKLQCRKIGHIGTLDPLATGVLIYALNEATKLIPYIQRNNKQYTFTIQWGEQRTTDDAQGTVINTSNVRPKANEINEIIDKFIGDIIQTPPNFSAIHINGERAYRLARNGENFVIPKRIVKIYDLKLLSCATNSADFIVKCGGGTYVRSLARDIAIELKTVGYVASLRRIVDGYFCEKDTICIENFDEIVHKSNNTPFLKPLNTVLDDISAVYLSDQESENLMFGRVINYPSNIQGNVSLWRGEQFIGIGSIQNNILSPKRLIVTERK
jgi:tRNA pseudouridine55 synthase